MKWGDVLPGDTFLVDAGVVEQQDLAGKTYLVTRVDHDSGCTDDGRHRWNLVKVSVLTEDGHVHNWSDEPGSEYFEDLLLGRLQ